MPLTEKDTVSVPGFMFPPFKTSMAVERGAEKNILIKTWGGLGDQICAEPTLRFALKAFKECDVSLVTTNPKLFSHLNFKRIFDANTEMPISEKYISFDTVVGPEHLTSQFISHMLVNCVDFASICAFRCMLPIADKQLMITGSRPALHEIDFADLLSTGVFIHAGRHWPSKTFPEEWWNEVIKEILRGGALPVLIGADTDDNRGTVNVNRSGCLDLRNQLSISESVWLLQRARSLLTNDSSPLHMAASEDPRDAENTGNCHVDFVATCKHPDYIMHWRKGQWGWRMVNHGRGGIWDVISYCPNTEQEVSAEHVGDDNLRKWLPDPKEFAQAAVARLK